MSSQNKKTECDHQADYAMSHSGTSLPEDIGHAIENADETYTGDEKKQSYSPQTNEAMTRFTGRIPENQNQDLYDEDSDTYEDSDINEYQSKDNGAKNRNSSSTCCHLEDSWEASWWPGSDSSAVRNDDSPITYIPDSERARVYGELKKGSRIVDEIHHCSYDIHGVIGGGSYGVVYEATKTDLSSGKNETRALKEYNPRLPKHNREYSLHEQMFRQEYETLASLKHANIVSVADFFHAHNTCYFDMDYINGENLHDYLNTTCTTHARNGHVSVLALDKAIDMMDELAKTVNYLHYQNILHLDLKLNNIIRRDDGHLIVIDFGQCVNLDKLDDWIVPIRFNTGYHEHKYLFDKKSQSAVKFTELYSEMDDCTESEDRYPQNMFKESLDLYSLGIILFDIFSICQIKYEKKDITVSDIRKLKTDYQVKKIICKALNLDLISYETSKEMLNAIRYYRIKRKMHKSLSLVIENTMNLLLLVLLLPIFLMVKFLFRKKCFYNDLRFYVGRNGFHFCKKESLRYIAMEKRIETRTERYETRTERYEYT